MVARISAQQLYNLVRRAVRDEDNARALAMAAYMQSQAVQMNEAAQSATIAPYSAESPAFPEPEDGGTPPTLQ